MLQQTVQFAQYSSHGLHRFVLCYALMPQQTVQFAQYIQFALYSLQSNVLCYALMPQQTVEPLMPTKEMLQDVHTGVVQ